MSTADEKIVDNNKASVDSKVAVDENPRSSSVEAENRTGDEEANRPAEATSSPAWMHKRIKIGSYELPPYASPVPQLLVVSFVCFLCPGMFNAVNGLGAAGQLDSTAANDANVALYSTFAVVGFFAGSIANRLGLRIALFFGGFGYFLYVSSFLSYNHTGNSGFVIFSGALLGVCAGCLWTAQGAVMMSYPDENSKGKFISWFWIIFNLGGVIGSLVPLGQNMHREANAVNDGTYIGFMILMFLGFVLSFSLVDSKHVRRDDGSRIIVMKNPSWKSELLGLLETLTTDWYIVLLFPMFLASNWFTTYQFNNVNLAKFNIRTRSLNSTLYWLFQMIGAFAFGYLLDLRNFRRTTRARVGGLALFALTMIVWGCGWIFQKTYERSEITEDTILTDFKDSNYIGPMFLYLSYGFYDAAFQTCVYWFMGSLTNNGRKLANFAGFYKGIQSAGAAITWRMDNLDVPYKVMFGVTWAMLGGSIIIAAPVIWYKIKDTSDLEADLKFSDETVEEVAPTELLEQRANKA